MTFIDSIRRQLQAMSATERQRAISSLRDLIYEDAYTHALHPATDPGVPSSWTRPTCGRASKATTDAASSVCHAQRITGARPRPSAA